MTGREILAKREQLDTKMKELLSTMTLTEEVKQVRKELKNLSKECPHSDEFCNFAIIDGVCPYCGGKVE